MVETIFLAKPRGFCAGVDRAIQVVEDALEIFGSPVYVKHQIVHNQYVVMALEKKGAITVEDVAEIPDGAIAVFSAHGSPPEDFQEAYARGIRIIDATCPLVTKVHLEVHRYHRNGFFIVYIGHKHHVEAQGVLAELINGIQLVETIQDVIALPSSLEKVVYLSQTTLSVDETKEIIFALRKKYPHITNPPMEDICYATTNRQVAIKALAKKADLILVVGAINSSNSNRLVETARKEGVESYLVGSYLDVQNSWLKGKQIVGISSGASAPEYVVQKLVHSLQKTGAKVEEIELMKENMRFTMPDIIVKAKQQH